MGSRDYGVLGLECGATEQEVHRAYAYLRRAYHPSNCPSVSENHAYRRLFQAARVAYVNICRENRLRGEVDHTDS